MVPLGVISEGNEGIIKRIAGKPEVKKHLENLGFIVGDRVNVITEQNGNIIVKVKESRIAISKEMAMKIYVL
ncbi:MAG: ferrous iron transport protein A [Clostridia bacterium]|nr:ferrous iron transport protein A [Clostridia bacterium]